MMHMVFDEAAGVSFPTLNLLDVVGEAIVAQGVQYLRTGSQARPPAVTCPRRQGRHDRQFPGRDRRN
jgi:hypothetical protein